MRILQEASNRKILSSVRRLKETDVINVLSDLFVLRGIPGHDCSDNGLGNVEKTVE